MPILASLDSNFFVLPAAADLNLNLVHASLALGGSFVLSAAVAEFNLCFTRCDSA
jgi:hypothetical protein